MAVEITDLLEHAQSPDAALRNQAEQQLKQFEEQNAVAYLTALATELASSHKPAGARQIAGLILKNALDAADEKKKVRRPLNPRHTGTPIGCLQTGPLALALLVRASILRVVLAGRSGRPMGGHGRCSQAAHQESAARHPPIRCEPLPATFFFHCC